MGLLLLFRSGVENPNPPVVAEPTEVYTGGTLAGTFSFGLSAPVKVLVGPANKGTYENITDLVPIDSIVIEESGTQDEASATFNIIDQKLQYAAMRGEWRVVIEHLGDPVFRGFIGTPSTNVRAIFGERAVKARDFGSLLDRLVVKSRMTRGAGESDKARIQWLCDSVGQPLVQLGLTQWGKVQVLNANMPKQTFPPRLTLRQAIERVLSASSDTARYYMDHYPRLHTFDKENLEGGWTATKNVNMTSSLGATEIAPEDFDFNWDTDGMVNGYYVQGKNAAGSGWYPDRDVIQTGPWSSDIFGQRQAYITAPDADTQAKAQRVAKAALWDTMNPIPRGSYSTFVGRTDTPYQAGQLQFVTSAMHGLNGAGTDDGPWAGTTWDFQPLRIVAVTTRYINGYGDREQEIEFGGRRIHRYSASIG